jgi:hypothetical protein
MTRVELAQIRELVARVGERIQPLLLPCDGLARRNAFAHIWLGIKTRFGDEWKECADAQEVEAFIRWIDGNPNAEYDAYGGSVTARGILSLFDALP